MSSRNAPAMAALALALALPAALAAGCAGDAPPALHAGMTCGRCGMSISQLEYACERRVDRGWKRYDSIECLLADEARRGEGEAYLVDYDSRALHAVDSMWVVRGDFPSPMGGGYAAFLVRGAADEIAARTAGRVDRLAGFVGAGGAR
ncbi:MAG: hypothetical protein ABI960_03190 [Candidatus Eisenbacteria bacterium]